MAPNLRKAATNVKRKFDNHRYFIIPKGVGDATCRTGGESVPRPNYGARSMHYHLQARHPALWVEATRNSEAAGKEEKNANGGVKKAEKAKSTRRVIIESDDEKEPSTSTASAPQPPSPVEDPQTRRRMTLEGEWIVERVEAMRIAQNGEIFWWVKWRGFPDEQSTWEPTQQLFNAQRMIDRYLYSTWQHFMPMMPSFQLQ